VFERLTRDARTAVEGARAQAARLGHGWVGTEHLLLSLCGGDQPTASVFATFGLSVEVVEREIVRQLARPWDSDRAALASLGIDLDQVRASVEAVFGPGALDEAGEPRRRRWRRRRRSTCLAPTRDCSPFTPRSKKCLELALREALRLQHSSITSEDLALGILREGKGLACAVLVARGVSLAALRTQLEQSVRRPA
jgi:ATP-dependent Clp protease ATP-binding subunit ClpA